MLDQKLKAYAESNIYPWHMPGHKRIPLDDGNPYDIDITEIDGFDNLHGAKGILAEAQGRAAQLYGAQKSYYLVNGSTCGLLAAVCASCKRGGRILVARNCHHAVYHAISIWNLEADYLYPGMTDVGIVGDISARTVENALQESTYDALLITSPTYDGVVSDIAAIARVAHAHGIPLIVDEAHGAHFGISELFPKSAVTQGADIVIQSMHKTLPSMTQTALLHLCSNLVQPREVERYLNYFETSSPSYVLMAGMERCIRKLAQEGPLLYEAFYDRLCAFYDKTAALQHLRVMDPRKSQGLFYGMDPSKILIFTDGCSVSGPQLHQILLGEYGLQMEMASVDYVLAMSSIMDTEEAFGRLEKALYAIDAALPAGEDGAFAARKREIGNIYTPVPARMTIGEAEEVSRRAMEDVASEDAVGRISAEFVYLYPPGIPILAPGEEILEKTVKDIENCKVLGLEVQNMTADGRFRVIGR